VADVDRANFGLLVDTWHLWREPRVAQRIATLGERLFGVHIADWPQVEPRSALDRVLPGQGTIDFPSLLGAIERAGYRGAYCLEIFSADEFPDSLWRMDATQLIQQAKERFLAAWQARLR
jgi:sugar phosphate isomerase/epimerase